MKNRTSGFTLIELMVVVLVIGLVVLVFTQIPLFTFSSWRKGMDRLKLQRDAHYAMFKIEHEVRPASFSDISASDSTLVIDNNGKQFFLEGNDLLFQKSSTDSTELVVDGGIYNTGFDVATSNNAVDITLTLERGKVDIILTTAVKPRN